MSRIRAKNTKPELLLRQAFWAKGVRYRIHARDLPGRPDIVIRIEAEEHNVAIHTVETTFQGGITISELEKLLPPNKFLRIHKSYIVALDRMRRVEHDRLHGMRLQSNIGLPVGRTYKAALFHYLNRRMPGGPSDKSTDG